MNKKIIPIRTKDKRMNEKEWLELLDQLEEVRQLAADDPIAYTTTYVLKECGEIIKQIRYKELYDENELMLQHIISRASRFPEQYPADYTARLFAAEVANKAGYEDRASWTGKLKKIPESRYATRLRENRFHL